MNRSLPTVSAIVLSFNRKGDTLSCLDSLQKQTYERIEIVVLDNGSQDDSVESIRRNHPNVRLLQMPRNYGDWEGRNIAFKNCTGQFIIIVDSDAVVPHDAVEKLLAEMRSDPSLAAVQPALQDTRTERMYDAGFGREMAMTPFFKRVFHGCTVMLRSDALRDAGGFPHFLLGGAEDFLSLRFYDAGYRVRYFPDVVVRHSMSQTERVPKHRLMYQSKQKLRAYVSLYPGISRVTYEIARALMAYTYHNCRRGFLFYFPMGLIHHLASIGIALQQRTPVKKNTLKLFDSLKSKMIKTDAEFDSVDFRNYRIDQTKQDKS